MRAHALLLTTVMALAGCSNYEPANNRPDAGTPDAGAPPDAGPQPTNGPQSVVIIHTNDILSQHLSSGPGIENLPVIAGGRDLPSRGGLVRMATVIERLTDGALAPPRSSPVVLVDSGSRMGGSLFALSTFITLRTTDALSFIESNSWGKAYLNSS